MSVILALIDRMSPEAQALWADPKTKDGWIMLAMIVVGIVGFRNLTPKFSSLAIPVTLILILIGLSRTY